MASFSFVPTPSAEDALDLPLGEVRDYPRDYAPEVLRAIPRALGRRPLGIEADALPFVGADLWRAWELSWSLPGGKPAIGVAEIEVPASSPDLIESKSLKLYLGSLNDRRFAGIEDLSSVIRRDLEGITGGPVGLRLIPASRLGELGPADLSGRLIDGATLEDPPADGIDPSCLRSSGPVVDDEVVSHLFRSLCPITGQPDWASVRIAYRGPAIADAALLRYLLSYRRHGGFHEACVERIFADLRGRCAPSRLTVQACFTRRGGIDINPWRSTTETAVRVPRPWRS